MNSIAIMFPPLVVIRSAIAAVWIYEGLWCKVLGRLPSQAEVVAAVPLLGPRFGWAFLRLLGIVETGLGLWALSGVAPGACAITQVVLLVILNANGLMWARQRIHDPAGMVIKNIAFLVLVWVSGAAPGAQP